MFPSVIPVLSFVFTMFNWLKRKKDSTKEEGSEKNPTEINASQTETSPENQTNKFIYEPVLSKSSSVLPDEEFLLVTEVPLGKRNQLKASIRIARKKESQKSSIIGSQKEVIVQEKAKKTESVKETSIKDYELVKYLAQGGFGAVFLVKQKDSQELLVIKVQECEEEPKEISGLEESFMNLSIENEIAILDYLSHPFIVSYKKTFNKASAPGEPFFNYSYMVMEYAQGENLKNIIKQMKRLPMDSIKLILAMLIEVLSYVHDKTIIFGDLKSENVMITLEGSLKLVDFGSARFYSAETSKTTSLMNSTTSEPKGTFDYTSPEGLYNDGSETPKSDFWALGCLAYEMGVGNTPFVSFDKMATISRIKDVRLKFMAGEI